MNWHRLWRHALTWVKRPQALSAEALSALEQTIAAMESEHHGEVRLCIERRWPLAMAASNLSARARAVQVFSELGVWDTEHNTGVLVYLSLADRAIEIVADRGLNALISPGQWQAVVAPMQVAFAQGAYQQGLTDCLATLDQLLLERLPALSSSNPNELPNEPVSR